MGYPFVNTTEGDIVKQACKQCGKEFELTQGEISFYESKGLDLPKRCKECREVNKGGKTSSSKATASSSKSSAPNGQARETLVTTKSASESGWSPRKLVASGVAAIAIVLASLFGINGLGGVDPIPTTNTGNATNTANVSTSTNDLHFRSSKYLNEHYDKHGKEMGFKSAEAYEQAAAAVVANPKALHKVEKEDGDDVYFVESTGEFVVVSTDGFIRTYYYADKDYFNRQ